MICYVVQNIMKILIKTTQVASFCLKMEKKLRLGLNEWVSQGNRKAGCCIELYSKLLAILARHYEYFKVDIPES